MSAEVVTTASGPLRSTAALRRKRHERTLLLLGTVAAVTGHGAGSSVVAFVEQYAHADATAKHTVSVWCVLIWGLAFTAATLLFYKAVANPLPSRLKTRDQELVRNRGLRPWLWGLVAAVSLYAVATAIHRIFGHFDRFSLVLLFVSGVLFTASVVTLSRLRDQILIVYDVQEKELSDGEKRTHLIITLSEVKDEKYRESRWRPPAALVDWSDPPDPARDLDALMEAKKARRIDPWPWEMTLRAILAHDLKLRSVTLICSPQSIAQASAFRDWIAEYPVIMPRVSIGVWVERETLDATEESLREQKGVEFDKVNELSTAMTDLLNHLIHIQNVPPAEIVIDFTGGKKPVSFVAAAATLRGDVLAQYVDTTEPHTPRAYNLVANAETRGVG